MLREAEYYARMAVGIRNLLRTPLPSDPERLLRAQLENREIVWLDAVRRIIFNNPDNPYFEMFRLAGCRYGDLAESVTRHGLEPTLAELHRQGVYLSHDEFKGRKEIVRSGKHISSGPSSFLNPTVSGWMRSRSSGSRSRGTPTPRSTPYQTYKQVYRALNRREFQLDGRAQIEMKSILPDTSGLSPCLNAARHGEPVERWFTVSGGWRDSGHYRVVTNFMVLLARTLGAKVPFPTYLPPNDFSPVAEWIARCGNAGIPCVVYALVSPAVRVAAAAMEKGLDIRGTLFLVAGEALTDAKRAVIENSGAEVYPRYSSSELGSIGYACRRMKTGNRVHLFRDALAVIAHWRPAPLSDVHVNSLLFTSLLPFAPRVLINAEMDDSGVIENAACDCAFARAGFTEQITDIYSFGKLTGHGMTLVGTDLLRILEETLPARLGGSPGDYQLVEREGDLQTELTLRVSPRVRLASAGEAKVCFLNEVRGFVGGAVAYRIWQHAEAIQVVIAEPFAARNGKILPLYLLGIGAPDGRAS